MELGRSLILLNRVYRVVVPSHTWPWMYRSGGISFGRVSDQWADVGIGTLSGPDILS